jgi:GTP-binding protein
METVIAIIGRPNVGKSTLFNRILGKRIAIVHPTSGVTRDRNYGEAEWTGKKFFLIDTGGFVPESEELFDKAIRDQIKIAIEECDKILFVVDGSAGLHPVDGEIAKLLRKHSKSKEIILAVNKTDTFEKEKYASEFFKLGLGKPFPIGALNGYNTADLLDELTKSFDEKDTEEDRRIKFAIAGRPNVGKSSISNAILNEDRNIVTDIPGTTRDSIDSVLKYYGEEIVLIDTAGLQRKSKIQKLESLEFYSIVRTYKAIERSDVAILVIDATTLTAQLEKSSSLKYAKFKLDKNDTRIIDDVIKLKKGLLIVINKWDLIEKDTNTAKAIEIKVKEHLKSYGFLKLIFISALTKQRIHRVIEEAKNIYDERAKQVKTSELNEALIKEIKRIPPPSVSGKEIKINYITQVKTNPPVIAFFTNEPKGVSENYKKFLERKIRENFGFEGTPITLVFKRKN